MIRYRYFVQSVGSEDLLFRWSDETERMEIFWPNSKHSKVEWGPDPLDKTPSTLNEGKDGPEDPYYIHEIDESIVNYKMREVGL